MLGPSKRGYSAKKRSEAALITAQNGIFFLSIQYVVVAFCILFFSSELIVLMSTILNIFMFSRCFPESYWCVF